MEILEALRLFRFFGIEHMIVACCFVMVAVPFLVHTAFRAEDAWRQYQRALRNHEVSR